jgi:hypothetical protein
VVIRNIDFRRWKRDSKENVIEMQGVGLVIMPSEASLAAPDEASGANWSREVEEIDPTGRKETALIGVFQKRGQVGILGSKRPSILTCMI